MASTKAAVPASIVLPIEERYQYFRLYVVFTDFEGTRRALKAAASFARHLDPRLVLLVPKVVPYPLPLDVPPVSSDFTEAVIRKLTSEIGLGVVVTIGLCRDRNEMIRRAVSPGSLVVIGIRKRWWLGGQQSLARQLRRGGHTVILIDERRMRATDTVGLQLGRSC